MKTSDMPDFNLSCPIPIDRYPNVTIAHGGGGKLMNQLIEEMFLPSFDNALLDKKHDGAVFEIHDTRIAFSTDSFVVSPLFFPGGDIGSLAIHGTVNDLAMCGARPLYLSSGLIVEEGLAMELLWRIVQSMQSAAEKAGVKLVTGDTKVVDKGKGDGIFINTAGVGVIEHDLEINPAQIRPGDAVIVSGDLGRHGIAIMAEREGLAFESTIVSDSASVAEPVLQLIENGVQVHCMRDLTRGGLASALLEISEAAGQAIHIIENALPVQEQVRGACEILGLDPIYVANEGRFAVFVPAADAAATLDILSSNEISAAATPIGSVTAVKRGQVTMESAIGATRIVDMMSGEQLPRIC
jgi:hydrogenase expression/formation protein HypE